MKDNERKCWKCGSSPVTDSIRLYRFPKPGVRNVQRCELWAKWCFPDKAWSSTEFQRKLYSDHLMLCNKHFNRNSFINIDEKKLHRHAAPQAECNEVEPAPPMSSGCFMDITNTISTRKRQVEPEAGCSRDIPDIGSAKKRKVEPAPPTSSGCFMDITNTISTRKRQVEPEAGCSREIPDIVSAKKRKIEAGCNLFKDDKKITETVSKTKAEIIAVKTNKSEKDHVLYIKCRRYLQRVCQLKNKLKKKKTDINMLNALYEDKTIKKLSDRLTPPFALLLQGQLKNCRRKIHGRRWTEEEKMVALRLFKRSPTCYRLMRRMFYLPAPSTLRCLLTRLEMPVGVLNNVTASLQEYATGLTPSENEFVLMFDEMSIKMNLNYNTQADLIDGFQDHGDHGRIGVEATHSLVFMLAGLRKSVKQPIAYYLSGAYVTADRLAVLIKEVIGHCFGIGISIAAVICDMDGVNRRALSNLGATPDRPVITYSSTEIVAMFDPPHLLKCFRNLFLKYDLKCMIDITSDQQKGTGLAKWDHLKTFYELDNANPNFVFAPSLKREHLMPNAKQKMKVNLAAQVFSHTVAAGMFAKISNGDLPAEATATANVIAALDKLFDCLNSSTPDLRRGKPHATNLSDVSPHLKLFEKMKTFFQTMEFQGIRQSPPSQQGWITTLNAVERLWHNMKTRHPSIKSLATRRLQQDPLENLFGTIRANCGSNSNPTVGQFIGGVKTAILSNLAHMTRGNCEMDENTAIIKNFKTLLEPRQKTTSIQSETAEVQPPLLSQLLSSTEKHVEESIVSEDSGEMQACAYVCGFLLRNKEMHCETCQKDIYCSSQDSQVHTFIQFKEYDEYKNRLKYASVPLIKCADSVASVINNFLKTEAHVKNLKKKVTVIVHETCNFNFLSCSSHRAILQDYIINGIFHICVKRFCTIRNREFATQASVQALKKKMHILKHL